VSRVRDTQQLLSRTGWVHCTQCRLALTVSTLRTTGEQLLETTRRLWRTTLGKPIGVELGAHYRGKSSGLSWEELGGAGRALGTALSELGRELGPELGEALREELGAGSDTRRNLVHWGPSLGPALGAALGQHWGAALGPALGAALGPALGEALGPALGHYSVQLGAELEPHSARS
jgi:hypothetical protein